MSSNAKVRQLLSEKEMKVLMSGLMEQRDGGSRTSRNPIKHRSDPLFHKKRRLADRLLEFSRKSRSMTPIEANFLKCNTRPYVLEKLGLKNQIDDILRKSRARYQWVADACVDGSEPASASSIDERLRAQESPFRSFVPEGVTDPRALSPMREETRFVAYNFLNLENPATNESLKYAHSDRALLANLGTTCGMTEETATRILKLIHQKKGVFNYKSLPKTGKSLFYVSFWFLSPLSL